jgi:hypothetical protein
MALVAENRTTIEEVVYDSQEEQDVWPEYHPSEKEEKVTSIPNAAPTPETQQIKKLRRVHANTNKELI